MERKDGQFPLGLLLKYGGQMHKCVATIAEMSVGDKVQTIYGRRYIRHLPGCQCRTDQVVLDHDQIVDVSECEQKYSLMARTSDPEDLARYDAENERARQRSLERKRQREVSEPPAVVSTHKEEGGR